MKMWVLRVQTIRLSNNARGNISCLLNPDTLVASGALQALVEFLDQHPEAGAVGARTPQS